MDKQPKYNSVPIFTVDAFTKLPFHGNPAAVCVVSHGLDLSDTQMQKIAAEMNLSETAFILPDVDADGTPDLSEALNFRLRWFTPKNEVDLCGHATLASSYVIFNVYNNVNAILQFKTLSGMLTARKDGEKIILDLPLANISSAVPEVSRAIIKVVDQQMYDNLAKISTFYSPRTKKLLIRLPDSWTRDELEQISIPDGNKLDAIHDGSVIKGVIISLKTDETDLDGIPYDFLSRYFAHWNGIPEDPVTGAAHTVLAKYWSGELKKTSLYARQCSKRGGDVSLTVDEINDRLYIGGPAYLVLSGNLHLSA